MRDPVKRRTHGFEGFLVGDCGHIHTRHRCQASQPGKPPGVVGVIMREDDGVKATHALASECASQELGVGTGIHENGAPSVSDEGRISLADIEHGERGSSRPGDTHGRKQYSRKSQRGYTPGGARA